MSQTLHHLKISLNGIKPLIAREVIVPSGLQLDRLHTVIQIAMGWTDSHMHEFIVGTMRDGVRYGMQIDDPFSFGPPARNEKTATLEKIAPAKGSRFLYWYDFGDDWYHTVVVRAIIPAASDLPVPYCVKAARACPPEDCGGPWGYANLLGVLADAAHADHEEMLEWLGGGFDPEEVDIEAINAGLATLGRRWKRTPRSGRQASS